MEQESRYKVAIIGAGPAGCMCAYYLQDKFDVLLFDKSSPLRTLLPTGGGRCNLAHGEYDFKELAKNYPRGEKFLYSVFSKFSTFDTIEFFKNIGVSTYIQEDMRIFPDSNSSKDVREKFLKSLKNVKIIKEEVLKISNNYSVVTNLGFYNVDYVVIATGGHASYDFIKRMGHDIVQPRPALVGLKTKEDFSALAGVSINGVLFTHNGVSGPEIYKISSLRARDNFPYKLSFDFLKCDIDLQQEFNSNPHKSIKNLLSLHVPKSFADFVLKDLNINPEQKCHRINANTRDAILKRLRNFEFTVLNTFPDGEVVTSGGVNLKEIDSKTMQSKLCKGVYFCGEVIDVDGYCGGFNLQNCWSTAYVAAQSLNLTLCS